MSNIVGKSYAVDNSTQPKDNEVQNNKMVRFSRSRSIEFTGIKKAIFNCFKPYLTKTIYKVNRLF